MWYSITDLKWQLFYAGPNLQNKRLLVCRQCLDVPNAQFMPRILPADPLPTLNARPEPFDYDNNSWISTQDDQVVTSQDGELFVTDTDVPFGWVTNAAIVDEDGISLVTENDFVITTQGF